MVVPPQQQMEFSSLIPNYSAPSSVCTSDSGGGGSNQGRLRTIRLHRRLGSQQNGPPTFGFSVRGGREHGTGFFVSAVEPGSEAHCQGLRVGDQIVRVNGFSVIDAIHREALQYIQGQNYLELRVRTVGMIPVKDKRTDPLTWKVVEDDRLLPPPDICKPVCNGNNEDTMRDVRLLLNVAPRTKLGCGICKGPDWKPGIFIQFTKDHGLAREAGLRPGDQILQCNGVPFNNIPFGEAVNVLKSSRQLDLIIRKGAGLELFPGESSGYNSSASSVNGDQSPNWGDAKRLSIVKEESIELEERLGQLDSNHCSAEKHHNWNRTEHNWEKVEPKQRRKDSPVLRVHFQDNVSDSRNMDETNRDMSELSLVSSGKDSVIDRGEQPGEQRYKDNTKLAEIRMVSQQLETKTVVVEVHRSEETDDNMLMSKSSSQRLRAEEDPKQHNNLAKSPSNSSFVSAGSSSAGSSLSSAISQELQRRTKRRENGDYREEERKKDILKAISGEKRQQHEQLMDEFKRVHQKMFAHTVVAENEKNNVGLAETSQLKVSHSLEERESIKVKYPEKEEEKVFHQRTLKTTKESSLRDRQVVKEVVKEVTILTNKSSNGPPPPPPPMPSSDSEYSNSSWKPSSPALSLASSGKTSLSGKPPSCPTPDYDTSSSSSVPSPTASLIIVNKNGATSTVCSPHQNKPVPSHNSPTYATVNKAAKTSLNSQSRPPAVNDKKTLVSTSQNTPRNYDSVEMQSIESFTLTNPLSQKPKPPETYFVPLRNKTQNGSDPSKARREEGSNTKKRPVSVTIGEYPTGIERRTPTRFEFLPSHNVDTRKSAVISTSETTGSSPNISYQLHSELAQTLSRSNLRKHTDTEEPHHNGISSAKGTVIISVNNQSPMKNCEISRTSSASPRSQVTNGSNKVHIENNGNARSKITVIPTENKNQSLIKSAMKNTSDKMAKSLSTNNRVTIMVPNGLQSKE